VQVQCSDWITKKQCKGKPFLVLVLNLGLIGLYDKKGNGQSFVSKQAISVPVRMEEWQNLSSWRGIIKKASGTTRPLKYLK